MRIHSLQYGMINVGGAVGSRARLQPRTWPALYKVAAAAPPPEATPARGAPGEVCVIDEHPPGSVLCSPCQQHSCPVKLWVKCNCDPCVAYSGGAFQSLGAQEASAAVCS